MSKLTIEPLAPFDFDLTLGVYGSFRSQNVDLYSRGSFQRVLTVEGQLHLVKATSMGTVESPRVTLAISPRPVTTNVSEVLLGKVKWMIGAELDLAAFYKRVEAQDSILASITRDLYGLKPPRTPSVFEALIIAISEQQTSLTSSSAVRGRLVKKYGASIDIESQEYYAFPTPEALANASPADLREVGFSARKGACIVEVAQKVVDGHLALETLSNKDSDFVVEALTSIKGIGRWTVEYMMCRGLGRYDMLPANDVGLKAAVSRFYKAGREVTEDTVRDTLGHLGEFQGYAAFYLIFAYAFEKYGLDPRTSGRQLDFGEQWSGS